MILAQTKIQASGPSSSQDGWKEVVGAEAAGLMLFTSIIDGHPWWVFLPMKMVPRHFINQLRLLLKSIS
ncbi:hypothetical protein SAY87_028821 [Trapa incisa]|uniref:Uncharacterized protein n=1 Tax=Trapa incisa TaxID=236973 RepID=A0AAN7KUQ7_9MYRT|nr:hypothetical protein SAY87_028821 [Trapa incisa]